MSTAEIQTTRPPCPLASTAPEPAPTRALPASLRLREDIQATLIQRRYRTQMLEIRASAIAGRGVFATERITAGSVVCEYFGTLTIRTPKLSVVQKDTRIPKNDPQTTTTPCNKATLTTAALATATLPTVPSTTSVPTPTAFTIAAPTIASPTKATPTIASPTKAAPTITAPTKATPTIASPTKAAPTITAPTTAAPRVAAKSKSSRSTGTTGHDRRVDYLFGLNAMFQIDPNAIPLTQTEPLPDSWCVGKFINHSCDPNVLAVTTNMQRDLGFTRAEAAYLRQPVNVSDAFHTHLARLKQTSLLDDVVVYVALHPIEIGTEITASYHRVNRSRDCTCGAPCCRRTF